MIHNGSDIHAASLDCSLIGNLFDPVVSCCNQKLSVSPHAIKLRYIPYRGVTGAGRLSPGPLSLYKYGTVLFYKLKEPRKPSFAGSYHGMPGQAQLDLNQRLRLSVDALS